MFSLKHQSIKKRTLFPKVEIKGPFLEQQSSTGLCKDVLKL